ncbi:MAG TPA: nucleoside triphosphate pyrophosphohydrolase, partial [Chromatiaceae bacterium]|nr:nucleoside triphosphate pyrophosphohydrolase [Chromatiaceae bacterium]
MNEKLKAFERLLGVMDDLREKCPWDKKQTLESLRNLTIEETYELADAILVKDMQGIKEELGDIMLHLVFYAKIASETNDFTIADVMNSVCDKLIYRHPHIYGDIKVNGEDEVKENWEKLKLKEGKKSILSGVPNSLPALVKAFRIQDKAKQVGFEWEHLDQVWDKVQEENTEFVEAVSDFKKDPSKFDKMEEEYGDLL